MMSVVSKDWNRHVSHAEVISRSPGFAELRDRITQLAEPEPHEVALDVGAGTGLLALALAPRVEKVWAIDIAPLMCEYLVTKAASAEMANLHVSVASADSLPLVDRCVDLVVSNYCYHHLDHRGKQDALTEAHRVLRPGGRLVFGDMMFTLSLHDARDRTVLADKVAAMLRKGPAGYLRLARNAGRVVSRRWEQPASADWWRGALTDAGFTDVDVELFTHEGGVASARRP